MSVTSSKTDAPQYYVGSLSDGSVKLSTSQQIRKYNVNITLFLKLKLVIFLKPCLNYKKNKTILKSEFLTNVLPLTAKYLINSLLIINHTI